MDPGAVAFIGIPAALAVVGFVAGVIGERYPRVPWIATGAILLGYGVLVTIGLAWYKNCPDCESWRSYDSTRDLDAAAAGIGGFVIAALIIWCIWLGAFLSSLGRDFLSRRRT